MLGTPPADNGIDPKRRLMIVSIVIRTVNDTKHLGSILKMSNVQKAGFEAKAERVDKDLAAKLVRGAVNGARKCVFW